jgi:methylated-DNA-protein-cysteine methyltransferase-like protein
MMNMTPFSVQVIKLIRQIPRGRVATYKQIAELSSKPHAARGVSWILHSCSTKFNLPWHRVLNSRGRISFPFATRNYSQQKRRLEMEGVLFQPGDIIDLDEYQWSKKPKRKPRLRKTLKN